MALSKTYEFGNRDGFPYIECKLCGKKSYNLGDIKNKFCGKCKIYHDDVRTSTRAPIFSGTGSTALIAEINAANNITKIRKVVLKVVALIQELENKILETK